MKIYKVIEVIQWEKPISMWKLHLEELLCVASFFRSMGGHSEVKWGPPNRMRGLCGRVWSEERGRGK